MGKFRRSLSRKASKRNFRRGAKVNRVNSKKAYRGGIRL